MCISDKRTQELMLLKMSLSAIRIEMNQQFDAMAAQIDRLIPDEHKFRGKMPQTKEEWKAEVATWK